MGLFDTIRELLSSGERSGGDRVESQGRYPEGNEPDGPPHPSGGDGAKTGGHGSHWDTVVTSSEEIKETLMATVQEGEPTEGVAHVGYVAGEAVRPLVVAAETGQITTGYPTGDGVTHEFVLQEQTVWANGHEAQFTGELGPAEVSFFPTNFYALPEDSPERQQVSFAAFAYALGPVEETTITTDDGETYETAGMAALLPMDGGDVDDYSVQTTVEAVTACEFRGRTVYQLRVPLFKGEDGETAFDVFLYASEHVLDDYVPSVGDDVAGAIWLQGHVEQSGE